MTNSIRRANPADAQLTWKNAEDRTRLSPRVVEFESGGPPHALVRRRDAAAWRAFVARRPAEIRRKVADARYLARYQHERAQITQICAVVKHAGRQAPAPERQLSEVLPVYAAPDQEVCGVDM